jgi:hypothetical protein
MKRSRSSLIAELRTLTGPLWAKGIHLPPITIEGHTASPVAINRRRQPKPGQPPSRFPSWSPGIELTHPTYPTMRGNAEAMADVLLVRMYDPERAEALGTIVDDYA